MKSSAVVTPQSTLRARFATDPWDSAAAAVPAVSSFSMAGDWRDGRFGRKIRPPLLANGRRARSTRLGGGTGRGRNRDGGLVLAAARATSTERLRVWAFGKGKRFPPDDRPSARPVAPRSLALSRGNRHMRSVGLKGFSDLFLRFFLSLLFLWPYRFCLSPYLFSPHTSKITPPPTQQPQRSFTGTGGDLSL